MKTNSLSIILIGSFFLFCVSIQIYSKEQSSNVVEQESKTFFDEIRELAAKMEVFPIDIFVPQREGPLGFKPVNRRFLQSDHFDWLHRYELTFDRYVPMFEFKECVYKAGVNDVNDCINRINEMSPKEKALLLIAIYIFEYRYRHHPALDSMYAIELKAFKNAGVDYNDYGSGGYLTTRMLAISYHPNASIDQEFWDKWLEFVERYKYDTTVVFPAIETPLDELQKEWEINIEKCKQVMSDKWNLPPDQPMFFYSLLRGNELHTLYLLLKRESPDEASMLQRYCEYFDVIDFKLGAATGYYDGNSSPFPKTLGDIATQILMSRLNYDDILDAGMLE